MAASTAPGEQAAILNQTRAELLFRKRPKTAVLPRRGVSRYAAGWRAGARVTARFHGSVSSIRLIG